MLGRWDNAQKCGGAARRVGEHCHAGRGHDMTCARAVSANTTRTGPSSSRCLRPAMSGIPVCVCGPRCTLRACVVHVLHGGSDHGRDQTSLCQRMRHCPKWKTWEHVPRCSHAHAHARHTHPPTPTRPPAHRGNAPVAAFSDLWPVNGADGAPPPPTRSRAMSHSINQYPPSRR